VSKGEAVPVNGVKAHEGVEVWLHFFLSSALDSGEWSTSLLDHCTIGKETRYSLNRRLSGCQNRSGHFGAVETNQSVTAV